MKIRSLGLETKLSSTKKYQKKLVTFRVFFVILFVAFFLSILSIDKIISFAKLKGIQGPALRSDMTSYVKAIPVEMIKSFFSSSNIKDMRIDIKFLDYEKLRNSRNDALKNKIISQDDKEFVNASIVYNGNKTKAKVRLKGDFIDHLIGNKWSFRVKVKNNLEIDGLSNFNIMNPQTKDFQGQFLIYKMLRDFNIITPRISLVNLIINGDKIGLMMISEHFNKDLLEHSHRKEGVIIKFDETSLWEGRKVLQNYYETENQAKVSVFSQEEVGNNEKLSKEFETAAGLMRGFLEGELMANEVFDIKLMANFLAIHDLWHDSHAEIWHNLRFYYNAFTSRLEPIANDELLYHPHPSVSQSPIAVKIRNDSYIHLAYINTLKEIQLKLRNDKFLEQFIKLDNHYEAILRPEFFLKPPPVMNYINFDKRIDFLLKNHTDSIVDFFSIDAGMSWIIDTRNISKPVNVFSISDEKKIEANLYVNEFYRHGISNFGLNNAYYGYKNNRKNILAIPNQNIKQDYISPKEVNLDKIHKIANVYYINKDNPVIQVQNFTPYTLLIKSIIVDHIKNNKLLKTSIDVIDSNIFVMPKSKEINSINSLRGRALISKEVFKNINLDNFSEFENIENIQLIMSTFPNEKTYSINAESYVETLTQNPIPNSTVMNEINKHNFLNWDADKNIFTVKKGTWTLTSPLIIPPGVELLINEKVNLLFSENSYILAHGKISILGSKENPINLKAIDDDKYWGGIAILGNSELPESKLRNVNISNTNRILEDGWSTNTGFLAYNVNLSLDEVNITNNSSEDALNLFKSLYYLNKVHIENTASDGVDSDFSTGQIFDSVFSNIGYLGGGDAIDFSGSDVLLSRLSINEVSDKGISIGEKSNISANNINLFNISVGIAIKDGSLLFLENSLIDKATYSGVMAYTKKNSYGGAEAKLVNVDIMNSVNNILTDLGSSVSLNDVQIISKPLKVKELYNTIMKKTTSLQ